ncbi:oxygenase MpaB family protein [Nocardia sp. NPDC059177]|uniref:oxygenase MpaB family protein n=1 Tax=Nocardia sp. NPDC059177 TaxID=3346759 RepID=UPI003691C8E8
MYESLINGDRGSVVTRSEQLASPQDEAADLARRRRYLTGFGAALGGPANVIMQLSLPPVGRGVVESVVESGSFTAHPVKRARTTLTYLAVAMVGDEQDRAAFRAAVGTAHRQVRSGPDSPVRYNAFDPKLQLWVAACLYRGTLDSLTWLNGELDEDFADELYRDSARFGTTLQVPDALWPADCAAFAQYWDSMAESLSFDGEVRAYLLDQVVGLGPYRRRTRFVFGRANRFFTTGFLPQWFRDELGLDWSPRRQRVFELLLRTAGRFLAVMPESVRMQPFDFYLADMRRRRGRGRNLI